MKFRITKRALKPFANVRNVARVFRKFALVAASSFIISGCPDGPKYISNNVENIDAVTDTSTTGAGDVKGEDVKIDMDVRKDEGTKEDLGQDFGPVEDVELEVEDSGVSGVVKPKFPISSVTDEDLDLLIGNYKDRNYNKFLTEDGTKEGVPLQNVHKWEVDNGSVQPLTPEIEFEGGVYRLWIHQDIEEYLTQLDDIGEYENFIEYVTSTILDELSNSALVVLGPVEAFDIVFVDSDGETGNAETYVKGNRINIYLDVAIERFLDGKNILDLIIGHESVHVHNYSVDLWHYGNSSLDQEIRNREWREFIAMFYEILRSEDEINADVLLNKLESHVDVSWQFIDLESSEYQAPLTRAIAYYVAYVAFSNLETLGRTEKLAAALLHEPIDSQAAFNSLMGKFDIRWVDGSYLTYGKAYQTVVDFAW